MITLIERMRQELVRRNYAATTIHSYIQAVEHFQHYIATPLEELGPDDLRRYHCHSRKLNQRRSGAEIMGARDVKV